MMGQELLSVAGGLGIFVYSLRMVSNAFDEATLEPIRKTLEKMAARSYLFISVGLMATIVLQASSATIVLAMGLLNRSIVSLEQATLLMLGATIGTTIKVWWNFDLSMIVAAFLIVFSSFGILLNWRWTRLRGLEICLGVGFTILGSHLVSSGLSPILESPTLLRWLSSCTGNTFVGALLAALCGALAAAVVQSSSSIVILTIAVASKGMLSIEGASAIILGANVGTTSTVLLLSIGQSISAKRLALMHFAAKAIGVFIALLFFKTFLSLISSVLPTSGAAVWIHLAAVDTGFNLINCLIWWTFLPILLRLGRTALPDAYDSEYWLSSLGVQKLLARVPERAIDEARAELQQIVRGLSDISQTALKLVTAKDLELDTRERILKATPTGLFVLERRLKNVEAVVGRVASKWGDKHNFRTRLFFLLERIYTLTRITSALRELTNALDASSAALETPSKESETLILALSKNTHELWDRFYQSLPEGKENALREESVNKGEFIFQSFFHGADFRNGPKLQKLYGALFALNRELGSVEYFPKSDRCHETTLRLEQREITEPLTTDSHAADGYPQKSWFYANDLSSKHFLS